MDWTPEVSVTLCGEYSSVFAEETRRESDSIDSFLVILGDRCNSVGRENSKAKVSSLVQGIRWSISAGLRINQEALDKRPDRIGIIVGFQISQVVDNVRLPRQDAIPIREVFRDFGVHEIPKKEK